MLDSVSVNSIKRLPVLDDITIQNNRPHHKHCPASLITQKEIHHQNTIDINHSNSNSIHQSSSTKPTVLFDHVFQTNVSSGSRADRISAAYSDGITAGNTFK